MDEPEIATTVLGRQAIQIEAQRRQLVQLHASFDALLEQMAKVATGEIDPTQVVIDLPERRCSIMPLRGESMREEIDRLKAELEEAKAVAENDRMAAEMLSAEIGKLRDGSATTNKSE